MVEQSSKRNKIIKPRNFIRVYITLVLYKIVYKTGEKFDILVKENFEKN